ncbi:MAG: hypothetical protein JSV79_10560 [Armatimonadota bacterium]|nr:MAG: hypothetical protein JSV79_10560 [Armatimonadota bacterium]
MKRGALLPKLVLALLLVSMSVGVSETVVPLFDADFEADAVGGMPSASPAGDPPDDQLEVQGTAEVVSSAALGSKALKIARRPTVAAVKCVAAPGPHESGLYDIRFKLYATVDESPLEVTVRSRYDGAALFLGYANGNYTLASGDGQETISGMYPKGTVHSIHIRLNMDTRKFMLRINEATVASDKAFFEDLFQDVHLLRVNYVLSTVAPMPDKPGECVVDDIMIQKYIPSDGPDCGLF